MTIDSNHQLGFSKVIRRTLSVALIGIALALFEPGRGYASLVSVHGGFTGYNGPVGGCGEFTSMINGQDVTPTSNCGPFNNSAQLVLSFPMTPSVDFRGAATFGGPTAPNLLRFDAAAPQNVNGPGEEFFLGSLTYANGIWYGINAIATFPIVLTTSSADPNLDGKSLNDTLQLYVTANGNSSPDLNADFVYFTSFTAIGSVRAYELFDSPNGNNTVTVDLYGKIGSLIPTRFADAQGGGFISAGIDPDPNRVPEVGAFTIWTLGLVGLAGARRLRKFFG